jgi:hypothetical protein
MSGSNSCRVALKKISMAHRYQFLMTRNIKSVKPLHQLWMFSELPTELILSLCEVKKKNFELSFPLMVITYLLDNYYVVENTFLYVY